MFKAAAIKIILTLILTLALITSLYAAPQMADYCYLPPFVMDVNTPPNIVFVYEKTNSILQRAYSTAYNADKSYYGFFDSNAKYAYCNATGSYAPSPACTASGDYLEKTNCTPSSTNLNCISGNILNWASMSSLDLSRKAILGFGWPDVGASTAAGDVFTYSGNFNGGKLPVSYGQWRDGNSITVSTSVTIGASSYTYEFKLSQAVGSNPTGLTINVAGATLKNNGQVAMKFRKVCSNNSALTCSVNSDCSTGGICEEEDRRGVIQKFGDKDKDFKYDNDAPRFAMRRWHSGNDKQEDIRKNTAMSDTERNSYFKSLLTAASKAPPDDPTTPELGTMMKDVTSYFSEGSYSYADNDAWTQSPYNWKNTTDAADPNNTTDPNADPATSCRKSVALFITTGLNLGGTTQASLPAACNPIPAFTYDGSSYTCSNAFEKNACYAYNNNTTDLVSGNTGKQNIKTYVLHTTFYGTGAANAGYLACAANVGGGEYIKVDDPASLAAKLEEIILNILASSASASTVATLTTQTRESSTLTQAYFYPRKENTKLKWTGYLRLLWSDKSANLREDTLNSAWLDLKKDKILSFYFDSTELKYKARLYNPKTTPADEDSYLKINSCDPALATTKENDDVTAIWNAQAKLQARTTDDRTIKIKIGDSAGYVTGGALSDFTTAIKTTLQPFWNSASYCSDYTSRWCASNSDCNSCVANPSTRSCPNGTNAECYYCFGNTSIKCAGNADCAFDYGTCGLATKYCTNKATAVCTGDPNCAFGTCNLTTSTCSLDSAVSCSADADCSGLCKGTCSGLTTRFCLNDLDCQDNYGDCTSDTCNVADGTTVKCNSECDTNCAESVIKFARGYDKPTPSGSLFRIRHDPELATTDNLATLKLGDIVYSTPRISPNSAVNGYDIMYQDTSYSDFIDSKIKGKNPCTSNDECPEGQTCGLISGLCSGGGYTPIVVVGANDGMVHAFKVSKIKDVNPAEDDCGGTSCDSVTDGYQTARFSDKPADPSDTAPPSDIGKELWAYIPYNAVPYLRWYCNDAYCHIPMVDARFTVVDSSIDYDNNGTVDSGDADALSTNVRTKNSWRRLLIGAMGVGGKKITVGSNTWSSSIFVLDITNPELPKLLWEKPLPDGTLTTNNPAIVRLASSAALTTKTENGKWYLVIGSGPTSITTNAVNYTTDEAKIYVFDLRNGDLKATISTGATGVAVGDMMAVDMDSDYQVDVIYFGTYGGTGTTQTGNFYRLRLRQSAGPTGSYLSPANWARNTAVTAGRPIYAGPTMALDASARKWIYFGTGLYLALEHASPTAYCTSSTISCTENSDCTSGTCDAVAGYQEYLYAFKENDSCWQDGSGTCTYSNFLDTTNLSFTGARAVQLGCFCAGNMMSTIDCDPSTGTCPSTCGTGEDTVVLKVTNAEVSGSGVPAACSGSKDQAAIDCLENVVNNTGCSGTGCNGWKRTLTGQKVFSKTFIAGGLVDYTSFQPTATVCSLGGNTYLGALHYTTGTPYIQPAILMSGGTNGATSSLTIRAAVNLGAGVPPLGESLVALPLAGDTYKIITQVSGSLPGTSMAPSLPAKSGYVLWIVK